MPVFRSAHQAELLTESDVEALIASGKLQKLTGEAANGERLMEKAAVTLRNRQDLWMGVARLVLKSGGRVIT